MGVEDYTWTTVTIEGHAIEVVMRGSLGAFASDLEVAQRAAIAVREVRIARLEQTLREQLTENAALQTGTAAERQAALTAAIAAANAVLAEDTTLRTLRRMVLAALRARLGDLDIIVTPGQPRLVRLDDLLAAVTAEEG